jgi:AraC-like DNA-binding protein
MSNGVRAAMARGFAPLVARYGLSAEPLLRGAGIDPAQIADPDAVLSLSACMQLLEEAARATRDGGFGIRLATEMPLADIGVLAYVFVHSPTLGAALANLRRYIGMVNSVGHLVLEVTRGDARLVRSWHPSMGDDAQGAQLALALFTRLSREGLGDPAWHPRAVHFRHRRPRTIGAQQRFFGAPLSFDRPADALVVPAADLRRTFRAADPELLPILLRHADETLARLPAADDLQGEVRRLVIEALGTGDVAIDPIAAKLGMSNRSLPRRLRADGVSFLEVVTEARQAMARRYLADPSLTLTDTAFLLGYSDLSAFSRAFRRWTGQTALDVRRAAKRVDAR